MSVLLAARSAGGRIAFGLLIRRAATGGIRQPTAMGLRGGKVDVPVIGFQVVALVVVGVGILHALVRVLARSAGWGQS